MAKEYYQKKLTAGNGISIDQNNVISMSSTGAFLTSINPTGIGKFSMNRADDPIPPAFSSTATYEAGDEVTYENTPYRALQDIDEAGEFDSTDWEQINYQGVFSSTLGYGNIAMGYSQSVRGQYNEPSEELVDIVGYGTSGSRANIETLDTNGNFWVAGRASAGTPPTNANDLVTKGWAESTFVNTISGSGLATPTTAQGQNGYSYAKYHLDVSTSAVVVDSLYQKINGEWAEIHVGGGGSTIAVDDALSTTSTNPVENRVITTHVQGLESTVSDLEEQMEDIGDAIGDVLEALEIINGSQMPELNEIADDINGEEI